MDVTLLTRTATTWAAYAGLTPDAVALPGTAIAVDPDRDHTSPVTFLPAADRVVVHAAAEHVACIDRVASSLGDGHALRAAELAAAWGIDERRIAAGTLNVLSPPDFRPATVTGPTAVRRLTSPDRAAFEALLAACPAPDRDEAEVGWDDELVIGTWSGDGLVAVASAFTWRGFADIGVLTHPRHRSRGFGAAAVSELCRALHGDPRVVLYRHDVTNPASGAIARRLGLVDIGRLERLDLGDDAD